MRNALFRAIVLAALLLMPGFAIAAEPVTLANAPSETHPAAAAWAKICALAGQPAALGERVEVVGLAEHPEAAQLSPEERDDLARRLGRAYAERYFELTQWSQRYDVAFGVADALPLPETAAALAAWMPVREGTANGRAVYDLLSSLDGDGVVRLGKDANGRFVWLVSLDSIYLEPTLARPTTPLAHLDVILWVDTVVFRDNRQRIERGEFATAEDADMATGDYLEELVGPNDELNDRQVEYLRRRMNESMNARNE